MIKTDVKTFYKYVSFLITFTLYVYLYSMYIYIYIYIIYIPYNWHKVYKQDIIDSYFT